MQVKQILDCTILLYIANADYVQITTSLTFTSTALVDCIQFNIVNDNITEIAEDFMIMATSGPVNATAMITITNNDNDGMCTRRY